MKNYLMVNLGSGPSGIEGWENLDWGLLPLMARWQLIGLAARVGWLNQEYKVDWPGIRIHDIRRKLPYGEGRVDYIYCSHLLEHLEKWQAESLIGESRRVFKKGGRIRIVVPDVAKLLKKYSPGNADKLCRQWWGFEKDRKPRGVIEKISRYFIRPHQWHYDFLELQKMINNAGFEKIKKYKFREGKVPDIKRLDLEVHRELSVYLEAIK